MHTELYQHMQRPGALEEKARPSDKELRIAPRQFTDPEELTEFAYAFICSLEAVPAVLKQGSCCC